MRAFLIILALAYWGVAILAQSYLAQNAVVSAVQPSAVAYDPAAPSADLGDCDNVAEDSLLVAVSYGDGPAGAAENGEDRNCR